MNESMASDAPDTADEGRTRAPKPRRPTPAPRAAPVGRATRTVRGGSGPQTAAPTAPTARAARAARETSGQSSSDNSDDEEAREAAIMKKLHPWLPNWSWIQGEPQTQQKPDRGRPAAPNRQTPPQENEGGTPAQTTPRDRSAGSAASSSRERAARPRPASADQTQDGTSVYTDVHRDNHARNGPSTRQRGRQSARPHGRGRGYGQNNFRDQYNRGFVDSAVYQRSSQSSVDDNWRQRLENPPRDGFASMAIKQDAPRHQRFAASDSMQTQWGEPNKSQDIRSSQAVDHPGLRPLMIN